mgnify:CR=1 FL=1
MFKTAIAPGQHIRIHSWFIRLMINIRRYKDVDWATICSIHDLARPDELRHSCDPRVFTPIEEDEEVEDFKRSEKLVAERGGEVIGFVGVDGQFIV